ncbi:aminotransferase class I/II-fold pyridoxal phosphate-dependent enzyme [Actinoplanes sp. LDG1-06]|uniref:Aminotransferase class I/II-fold pyridoxal phosphate-dependent enzyme n=1 Tax=Paractinoplanes ovalisporus TaxID=2810368 RepID=A0ABS2AF57_9ACTN|nr:aminotransferase class I/II-fold pyridoxal phosphate-dependent enzyme [Actinoplanes ovalisporus]MBM2618444.1 aminotransferase class I/II-fold pyridoxal phosphate-dependent enzyme [Actinoplanes ovalisporus]
MIELRSPANLTQYEWRGLGLPFNLADGHAHQLQDSAQREIVRRLPTIFADGERTRQADLEATYREAFYRLAGQHSALGRATLLCTSASQAIDLIACALARRGMSVTLLEPCFDNLATLLQRRQVRLAPVNEAALAPGRIAATVAGLRTDALFLTLPNNPTGFSLDPSVFEHLAHRCAAEGIVLIVDCTFRFFDARPAWDQYEILARSGVRFICVEDTGKTWPTLELKCGMLAASPELYPALVEPHNDMLLNVSPFVLRLLVEYLADSEQRGLDRTVRRHTRVNRAALREAMAGSILVPDGRSPEISVEWVRVEGAALTGREVVDVLAAAGIGALPGENFFWNEPGRGARHLRFALARDPVMFRSACLRLREVLGTLDGAR